MLQCPKLNSGLHRNFLTQLSQQTPAGWYKIAAIYEVCVCVEANHKDCSNWLIEPSVQSWQWKQLQWLHIWFCPLALGRREVVT